jgi:carboxyl-terminal processing protease
MRLKTKKSGSISSDLTSSRRITSRFGKAAFGLLIGFFLFCAGIGVGDGRLSLGFDPNPSKTLPNHLNYASVDEVYNTLRGAYDGKLDETKLMDGLKQGMAEASGDPYTMYFTPDEARKFTSQLNNEFSGIGAELGQDKDKNLIVVSPIAGTPAAQAGIKPQDVIAEIDKTSTSGISVDAAVTKIRGEKGTKVTLKLIRNHEQTINVTITRDDIKIPSVTSKVLDGNVGYLRINTFADDSGQLANDEAQKLKDAGIKSVILDLRGNPGGRVDAAVSVASLWLPEGKIIMQEKRGSVVQTTHTATGGTILNGLPTAVLIDSGSASASEIVAGALRDQNVAKLLGEKSYGKGSVQQVIDLKDGSELKVTVARWYRPNGQNIDKKGIDPDQVVKPSADDVAAGKDVQLDTAQAALRK